MASQIQEVFATAGDLDEGELTWYSLCLFLVYPNYLLSFQSRVVGSRENSTDGLHSPSGAGDKPPQDNAPF